MVDFIDTANRMKGWKTTFSQAGAWIRYNAVDFGTKPLKAVEVMGSSAQGSAVEIRLDQLDGMLIGTGKVEKNDGWRITKTALTKIPKGTHDLFIVLKGANAASIDWVRFE